MIQVVLNWLYCLPSCFDFGCVVPSYGGASANSFCIVYYYAAFSRYGKFREGRDSVCSYIFSSTLVFLSNIVYYFGKKGALSGVKLGPNMFDKLSSGSDNITGENDC